MTGWRRRLRETAVLSGFDEKFVLILLRQRAPDRAEAPVQEHWMSHFVQQVCMALRRKPLLECAPPGTSLIELGRFVRMFPLRIQGDL